MNDVTGLWGDSCYSIPSRACIKSLDMTSSSDYMYTAGCPYGLRQDQLTIHKEG